MLITCEGFSISEYANMNNSKVCNGCLQEKPFTDFYTKRNGQPFSRCKTCLRLYRRTETDDMKSGVKSEQRVIDLLNSMGIPSLRGKSVSHAYADIVSWGCVLIETKTSKREGGRGEQFVWAFSEAQQRDGLRADLIILECEWDANTFTYHLFSATDEKFYRNGKLKAGSSYTVNRRNAGRYPAVFTAEIMEAHRNRWDMITSKRIEIEEGLRNGQSWLIRDRLKAG